MSTLHLAEHLRPTQTKHSQILYTHRQFTIIMNPHRRNQWLLYIGRSVVVFLDCQRLFFNPWPTYSDVHAHIADFIGLPYFSRFPLGLKSHVLISHDFLSQSKFVPLPLDQQPCDRGQHQNTKRNFVL